MEIRRVAIIFDSVQRPETTGGYCLRALKRLVDVEHFQPGELDRAPRAGFDLYLNIDDGMRYHLPHDLRPSAWWAIDTHMDLARCIQKAQGFDLVFAAQRDGADELRRAGIGSATWLPASGASGAHFPENPYKTLDQGNQYNSFLEECRHALTLSSYSEYGETRSDVENVVTP
jgi:hypothetical protein